MSERERFTGEPRIPVPFVPPALPPVLSDGLCVCCIRLIGRDGLDPDEGDTLVCEKCLTRVVFQDGLWEWDITAEITPEYPPWLPLSVPPPGVVVEDPPDGGGAFVGRVDGPPEAPGEPLRGTMMDPRPKGPPVFEPPTAAGVKFPDQEE